MLTSPFQVLRSMDNTKNLFDIRLLVVYSSTPPSVQKDVLLLEKFNDTISRAQATKKVHDAGVGDLNSKVGVKPEPCFGNCAKGKRNGNGQVLVDYYSLLVFLTFVELHVRLAWSFAPLQHYCTRFTTTAYSPLFFFSILPSCITPSSREVVILDTLTILMCFAIAL